MKQMNPQEIRTRLAEIKRAEEQHQARDFDAELKEAHLSGGDVDELETRQLDAERVARRLRVERQALHASLPAAEREQAEQELDVLAKTMAGHVEQYRAAADSLVDLLQQIAQHRATISRITRERSEAFSHAERLCSKHGLPVAVTEPFCLLKSSRLTEAEKPMAGALNMRDGYASSFAFLSSGIDIDTVEV